MSQAIEIQKESAVESVKHAINILVQKLEIAKTLKPGYESEEADALIRKCQSLKKACLSDGENVGFISKEASEIIDRIKKMITDPIIHYEYECHESIIKSSNDFAHSVLNLIVKSLHIAKKGKLRQGCLKR